MSGSCLISGELSGSRLTCFELGGSARATLHSANLSFRLPCVLIFQLPVGAGGAHRAAAFQPAARAIVALLAAAFQLAVGAGRAHCAVVFHLAVRAGGAHRADAFPPAMRAEVAPHALAFHLPVRASLPSYSSRATKPRALRFCAHPTSWSVSWLFVIFSDIFGFWEKTKEEDRRSRNPPISTRAPPTLATPST